MRIPFEFHIRIPSTKSILRGRNPGARARWSSLAPGYVRRGRATRRKTSSGQRKPFGEREASRVLLRRSGRSGPHLPLAGRGNWWGHLVRLRAGPSLSLHPLGACALGDLSKNGVLPARFVSEVAAGYVNSGQRDCRGRGNSFPPARCV